MLNYVLFSVLEKENLLVTNAFKCLMEICMENMVSVVTVMFLGIFEWPEMVFTPKDLLYLLCISSALFM